MKRNASRQYLLRKSGIMGRVDDLKTTFNPETGAGTYMMADRTPQPAKFKVNKFGNLQVDISSLDKSASFARRK